MPNCALSANGSSRVNKGREVAPGDLREAVISEFATIMRHVSGWHLPEFLAVDVTMSQAKLLHLVSAQPGIGMSALAARLGVGLSAVSSLVDRLVEHGYIERNEDPSDRRQQLVTPTPAGEAVMDRMRQVNLEHMRILLVGLSDGDLRALRTGLSALARRAASIDQDMSVNRPGASSGQASRGAA
jgi:DNA-binding MarR family transcriptional regulator